MELPKRKPNRLKNYDYSSNGAYFITICTHERKQILSRIVGAIHESPESILTPYGRIVDRIICHLPQRYDIYIDAYVIMPNHIHLLIVIDNPNALRAIHGSPLQGRSIISKATGYLKMNVSKEMHKMGYTDQIWQRSFHDHVIRSERDYLKIWQYINSNPSKWTDDCFYAEQ